jgi:ubiquinone/menaquinone biosynthesis C-methylase UbiE
MYDQTASKYGDDYKSPAGHYFMWRKIETILKLGKFKEVDKILEIGCANGVYTFEFSKLGFTMTGLDLSDENVAEAKRRSAINAISKIDFMVGDAENMKNIPAESFDGVISISALRYGPNLQKAIDEIYRIVKKK